MGAIILLLAVYVFFVNAMYLAGKADAKGTGAANILVGIIMGIVALYFGFTNTDLVSLTICSLSLSFTLFYLLLGWGLVRNHDLKEVGYYSLYAGGWCLLCSGYFFASIDWRFGGLAALWGVLFLSVYGLLVVGKLWARFVSWLLVGESLVMLAVVFLMVTGAW